MGPSWEPQAPAAGTGRRQEAQGERAGAGTLPHIPEKPEFPAQQPMTTTSKGQLGGGGQQEALKTRSLKGTPHPQHLSASKWQEPGRGGSSGARCPYQLPLRGAWRNTGCPSAAHVCRESRSGDTDDRQRLSSCCPCPSTLPSLPSSLVPTPPHHHLPRAQPHPSLP